MCLEREFLLSCFLLVRRIMLLLTSHTCVFQFVRSFTPGCSKSHLPSFINAQSELKQKGVDKTICVATNDPFVMEVRTDET